MNPPDTQIQADIEALKARFTNTQELYREVAAVLFFRYGLPPTANKLYQLVRKGSMSAPAEALNRFWADLREKSRVRIEAPDLPDTLATQAGEMLSSLWGQAQVQARESLTTLRDEVEAQLIELVAERDRAIATIASITFELNQVRDQAIALEARAVSAEQQLAKEIIDREVLLSQLSAATRDVDALQVALTEARQDFALELDKTRSLLAHAEERATADTKRHLLEIDRERTFVNKAQQELKTTKATLVKQKAADQKKISDLQGLVGDLREASGQMKGRVRELERQLTESKRQLTSVIAKLVAPTKVAAKRQTTKSLKSDSK